MQGSQEASNDEHYGDPLLKLNKLKYDFAMHAEQPEQLKERDFPSNKFQEKVRAKRKRQRRIISTSSVESESKRKLRKFETATKETLRRFKSSIEGNDSSQIDYDDHLGQLISSADWERNKMDLINSVSSTKEDEDRRKRKIIMEINRMQMNGANDCKEGTVELTSSGIDFEEVDKSMKYDSNNSEAPGIEDIVKTSPFYQMTTELKEQEKLHKGNKNYFNSTEKISKHAEPAIVGIDEAKALYDTSLNLSEWGSFIKSQLSEEEDTSPRIISFSQMRNSTTIDQRGSVIEVDDSYEEDNNAGELIETLGTQKEPIWLDSSQKENIIEIPNTSEDEEQDLELNAVPEVIEIENSTDDDGGEDNDDTNTDNLAKLIPTSSPIISVHNTPLKERLVDISISPARNVYSRQTTVIEVPSSEPLSPSKEESNDASISKNTLLSEKESQQCAVLESQAELQGQDVNLAPLDFVWEDNELHNFDKDDEIGASQTQVAVEDCLHCGEDDGTPLELANGDDEVSEKFETLIKEWPVELLAKQMQVWGLKPVKSKVGMVRALCEISTMIPTQKLAWVIERNEGHCVIDFAKYEEGGGESVGAAEADVGQRLRQMLIEKLECDAEIKEAIAIYKPVELEWVCSRVEPSWEGLTLDRHWVSKILDDLGVCWTPINSAKVD